MLDHLDDLFSVALFLLWILAPVLRRLFRRTDPVPPRVIELTPSSEEPIEAFEPSEADPELVADEEDESAEAATEEEAREATVSEDAAEPIPDDRAPAEVSSLLWGEEDDPTEWLVGLIERQAHRNPLPAHQFKGGGVGGGLGWGAADAENATDEAPATPVPTLALERNALPAHPLWGREPPARVLCDAVVLREILRGRQIETV